MKKILIIIAALVAAAGCATCGQSDEQVIAGIRETVAPEVAGWAQKGDVDFDQIYAELATLSRRHPAVTKGECSLLDDQWVPDDVLAFTLTRKRDQILVIVNETDRYLTCALPADVRWRDAQTGDIYEDELVCPVSSPWEYRILIRK